MDDSQSDQRNWWQSLWHFLKSCFLTEFVVCVLSLVLAAIFFPGAFGGIRLVLGAIWLLVLMVVLVLLRVVYYLWCAWDFATGNDTDESVNNTDWDNPDTLDASSPINGRRRASNPLGEPTSHSMRVFYVEDAELTGTFYPLSNLRFDTDCAAYVERDDSCAVPESLHELNITLDDIRSITDPAFPEFDEVRSWTPGGTEDSLMENYVAFGAGEHVALVVQLSEHDTVETMHFHIWYIDDKSILPQIVDLFLRIAARWQLLFETLNTQQVVIHDEWELTAYVNELCIIY
jgi:hypothetical protein